MLSPGGATWRVQLLQLTSFSYSFCWPRDLVIFCWNVFKLLLLFVHVINVVVVFCFFFQFLLFKLRDLFSYIQNVFFLLKYESQETIIVNGILILRINIVLMILPFDVIIGFSRSYAATGKCNSMVISMVISSWKSKMKNHLLIFEMTPTFWNAPYILKFICFLV